MTIDELRSRFKYDPDTGTLYRMRGRQWQKMHTRAHQPRGYFVVGLGARKEGTATAHRIAWALHYGAWPDKQIDHINGDRIDNRLANLRLATNAENQCNRRRVLALLGAYWDRSTDRWKAQIKIGGKVHHLGRFDTAEEAAAVYREASIKFQGEFSPFVTGRAA